MKQLLEDLLESKNIRASLSGIRAQIKDGDKLEEVKKFLADKMYIVEEQLRSEDAKTRKNAALLLGDLEYDKAKQALYDAYISETTLFVKEAYLTALSRLDVKDLVADLKQQLEIITNQDIAEENRKHVDEEIRAIRKIIIKYEGISKHSFIAYDKTMDLILTCNSNHREIVRRQVGDNAKLHPLGVAVANQTIEDILNVRSFRELLFPIKTGGLLPQNPKSVAEAIIRSDFIQVLKDCHKEKSAFYYRIECRANMELDKRSDFSKKLAGYIDSMSDGMLINSTGDYEIEIRLIANKEGKMLATFRLSTIKDGRFNYRKNAISASIHPSTAALIMQLVKPYLVEHAQIIDPFCGVGTMLIERNYCVNARDIYGTDVFGDAIDMARENTSITGMNINYIHRDFFDFKHDYKFDEIITNMPVRGKKTKEEMDELYRDFFDKALTLMADKGIIIMYTNEIGFVKKNLRMHKELNLLQETLMLKKGDYYLLVIGR